MITYSHSFITSFLLTISSETLVLFLLVRKFLKIPAGEIPAKQLLFAGFFASFATLPYVWYVFPGLFDWTRAISLPYSELFVFLVEALFYRMYLEISWKKALLVSLLCNSVSFALGPLLRSFGLWFYW